ncbi:MAG: hypothetical protein ACOC10_07625 [Bacteroidota bacterium]
MILKNVFPVILSFMLICSLQAQQKVTPPSDNSNRNMNNNKDYKGLMVEGHLGLTGSSIDFVNTDDYIYDFEISGTGIRIGGKLGYRTSRTFMLNVGLDIYVIPKPLVGDMDMHSLTVTCVNLLGGTRLYLSDNFFLGANLTYGQVGITNSETDYSGTTEGGLGYNFSIGNTWWAGNSFGIELEAFMQGLSTTDKDEGYNIGIAPSDVTALFYGISIGFVLK